MQIQLSPSDLALLFREKLYLIPNEVALRSEDLPPQEETVLAKKPESTEPEKSMQVRPSVITWKSKPDSRVLFILRQQEMANKDLTDFLKKVVSSLEIPFESAGFGVYSENPSLKDLMELPTAWGVVFEAGQQPDTENPLKWENRNLFFSHTLAELVENVDYKKELWNHLKIIKASLI